jgi:ubiquinone/menaquinone biosynthesis C-methylase UbiE
MKTQWSDRIEECEEQFSTERNDEIRVQIQDLVIHLPVLEVGCGTQELKRFIPDGEYIGLDLTPEFEPDIVGDAQDLPLPDDRYPTVVTKNVLQHVPDWKEAISECARVSRMRTIHVERTHESPTDVTHKEPVLRRRFYPADFLETMKEEYDSAHMGPCYADGRLTVFRGTHL